LEFISDLAKNFDQKSDRAIEILTSTLSTIMNRKNLLIGISAGEKEYPILRKNVEMFIQRLPDKEYGHPNKLTLNPSKMNEAILTPMQVQHIYLATNFKSKGYPFSGKMLVLAKALEKQYIWPEIREKGGAYGGSVHFDNSGEIVFSSYRDPHLRESIEIFRKTPEFLAGLKLSEDDLKRNIIRVIADSDNPQSNEEKVDTIMSRIITGRTDEIRQRQRDEILATRVSDIPDFGRMLKDCLQDEVHTVIGYEEKLKTQGDLFDRFVEVPD
ncbi:MAG: hypothetical protein HQK54_09315, partial [Oligoflexales bacterium]|nr:hypothetical protein [Oligoflexales bacterium]